MTHFDIVLSVLLNCIFHPLLVVSQEETLKLLYRYRAITAEKIDRVKFCELLHNTFGMTDDYFMDKGD